MAQLLVDVGNSRIKWALAEGGVLGAVNAQAHRGDPVAAVDAVAATIAQAPAGILIASVAGSSFDAQIAQACVRHWPVEAQFAAVQNGHSGLRLAYSQPQRLGVDRWLMMLALWQKTRAAFVVASAGTALTVDVVDARGQHLGGVIAPGLVTMQQAVLGATRFAASGVDHAFDNELGADTEACVRQGALHACAGLLDRLAARYAAQSAVNVLSGGDAATLQAVLASPWTVQPDLVLAGLLALSANSP